jgi:hypothetical protein
MADGTGPLPGDVSPRLTAAWRNTTSGPHERAKAKATADFTEAALRELGLTGGFMDILPPRWELRGEPGTNADLVCWTMDEASMATSAVIKDILAFTNKIILAGDPFQLPAILEATEKMAGITGALAQVPLQHQVHLFHDRRTRGETQHLRAAQAILQDDIMLTDLTRWSQDGSIPGFTHARRIDLPQVIGAPVLCYYRNSTVRISIEARRMARLPDDHLMPGERLLIESIARDRREILAELGIIKNTRVIVLEQTSAFMVTIVAEALLARLLTTCAAEQREPTRTEIETIAVSVPLGVSYTRD